MNKNQLHQAIEDNTNFTNKQKGIIKRKLTLLSKQFSQDNQQNKQINKSLVQQVLQSQSQQEIKQHIEQANIQALSSNNIQNTKLNKFNLETKSKVKQIEDMIDNQNLDYQQTNQLYNYINKLNVANSQLNYLPKNNDNKTLMRRLQKQIDGITDENIFQTQPDFFDNQFYQDKLPQNKYNELIQQAHVNSLNLKHVEDVVELTFSLRDLEQLYVNEVFVFTKIARSKISEQGIEYNKLNQEVPKDQRQEIYGMSIKIQNKDGLTKEMQQYFKETNNFLPINHILKQDVFTKALVSYLQYYDEFTDISTMNTNETYFLVRIVNGKRVKFWYNQIDMFVQILMNANQQVGDEDFYGENKELNVLVLSQLVTKRKGQNYIQNTIFESKYGMSIQLVKNDDDKCLAAACFLSILMSTKIGTEYSIILDKEKYDINVRHFSEKGLMCQYENNQFKKNLYFYTDLFITKLKIKTNYSKVTEVLMKEIILRTFGKELFIINNVEEDLPQNTNDLFIYKYDNHYCVIKNYTAFLKKHFNNKNLTYCFKHQSIQKQSNVLCKKCEPNQSKCKICKTFHSQRTVNIHDIKNLKCDKCNKDFKTTEDCFERHVKLHEKDKDVCLFCKEIHTGYKNDCAQAIENDLKTFAGPNIKKDREPFLCYDIESYFDTDLEDKSQYQAEQIPFLLAYIIVLVNKETNNFEICRDKDFQINNDLPHSKTQGKGNYIICKTKDEMWSKFMTFLLFVSKELKIKNVYAHNGGKYDTILLLNYLQNKESFYDFDPLFNGGRLLQLKVNNITFKDSMNILTFPLDSFNKNLGLDKQQQLYGINSSDKMIQDYDKVDKTMLLTYISNGGKIIDYNTLFTQGLFNQAPFNKLDDKQQYEFLQKYGDTDFLDYYIDYCIQDTVILALGLIEWSNVTLKQFDNNILNYLTLPSFSYQNYLQFSGCHLFDSQINQGKFNVSKIEKEVQWLIINDIEKFNLLVDKQFVKLEIVSQNVKFDKGSNYNVDLIVQDQDKNKFVIEVDGNYWHGIDYELVYDKYQKTILKERFRKHKLKSEYLDNHLDGKYQEVIHILESDFNQFKKQFKGEIKLDCTKLVGSQYLIEDRSILRGGSTSPLYNYVKFDNKKFCLKGYDLTSEYPGCMLLNLPLGDCYVDYSWKFVNELIDYSKLILQEQDLEERFEMICESPQHWNNELIQVKCAVLAPQDLELPSLNVKICDKLLSPLCRTCAENQCKNVHNNNQCNHNIDQRKIIGFFDQSELLLALVQGYRFIDVYETYVFRRTSYNTEEYKGNKYIETLIFYKTLFSDKNDYNDDVLQLLKTQKVIIDWKYDDGNLFLQQDSNSQFMKVELNSAYKNLYKLSMNALYGKTGQDQVRNNQKIDKNYTFLERTYNENIHKDLSYQSIKDTNAALYTYKEPYDLQILNKTQSNASLAGRITALARVCLFFTITYIQTKLGGRVIYHDTDSAYSIMDIKYKDLQGFSLRGTFGIKSEEKLHDANEFICLSPKCYAYSDGIDYYATSKGICLIKQGKNTRTLNVINYEGQIEQQKTLQKQQDLQQKVTLQCYRNQDQQDMITIENVTAFSIYKEIILDIDKFCFVQQDTNFERDLKTRQIFRQKNLKIIRYNERKRVAIQLDNDTIYSLPFGYLLDQ